MGREESRLTLAITEVLECDTGHRQGVLCCLSAQLDGHSVLVGNQQRGQVLLVFSDVVCHDIYSHDV